MTFDELLEEVYEITNRRALIAETKSAVKAATLKAHATDFYSKDIFETGITFTESAYKQSLDYITLLSNFRAFKYLRRAESVDDDDGQYFSIIKPEEVLDEYGTGRTDIAYVAGRVLEIRSSVEFQYALLGCYVHPIVRESAYTSWVAEQHPYFIIHEAARRIFLSIGQKEEAAGQKELVAEELTLLKMTGLTDVGY